MTGDAVVDRGGDGSVPGLGSAAEPSAIDTLDGLFRREYGRLVGMLARRVAPGRPVDDALELASDAVSDALAEATRSWPLHGLPADPSAWLYRVSWNRCVDRLRRESRLVHGPDVGVTEPVRNEAPAVWDAELGLIALCCDPALTSASRAVLTLKIVGGIRVEAIAASFLISNAAAAQRVVRAKRTLRSRSVGRTHRSGEPDPGPWLSDREVLARMPSILDTLYLMFTHAVTRAGDPATTESPVMMREALRLATRLLDSPAGRQPEVRALAALMALHAARYPARFDAEGRLCRLEDQDRRLWDRALLRRGLGLLAEAAEGDTVSEYHLLAGIAAEHGLAPSFEATRWDRILQLYDDLIRINPTPIHRLNRAVARMAGAADDPAAILTEVEALPRLDDHPPWYAARAELLSRVGRDALAQAALGRAADLARTDAERRAYLRRAATLAALVP